MSAGMIGVHSSNVAAIQWDGDVLFVRFKSGETYQYDGVPFDVYFDFLNAPSKGKFLHYHVKSRWTGVKL